MPSVSSARRQKRKRRRDSRRKMLAHVAAKRAQHDDRIPLPPRDEFLRKWVKWPHIETKEPVSEITEIGADYLANCSCFRRNADGTRRPGSDVILKPRRAFMTTLIWGCLFYELISYDRLRAVTAFQVGNQDEVIEPAISQVRFMLSRLPEYWVGDWRRKGDTIYLGEKRWIGPGKTRSGGKWTPISSGHTREIADKRGRSADCDIFHASETGIWLHPKPLFNAVGKALPAATGMLISESTQPETREQYHAQAYLEAKTGTGKFQKAFFWPWWRQRYKRIPRAEDDFKRFMSTRFTASMPPEELERERTIGLNDEQRAFRRKEFFSGDAEERRLAHRENPENDTDGFVYAGKSYFNLDAIEVALSRCAPPLNADATGGPDSENPGRHPFGRHFGISVWDWEPTGHLVLGVDVAEKEGQDYTAVEVIDARTYDQIAEIHGRALASEMAASIEWLLERLVEGREYRYTLVIESNRGKALIGECELRKLKQYTETAKKASREAKRRIRRKGLATQGYNRNRIIDAIGDAIQGPQIDEDGAYRAPAPTCRIWSKYLVDEIKGLQYSDKRRRVDAGDGYHDDLPMAYGIARYVAPRVRVVQSRGRGSAGPSVRTERRPRRSGTMIMPG